jgi:excisionase family DNA binding protein
MATSTESPHDNGVTDRLYLRVKTAHEMTGISEPEIYKAIYTGQLRARKYKTRVWLITHEDLEAWIAANSEFNIA